MLSLEHITYPNRIVVEPTSSCNARCPMCIRTIKKMGPRGINLDIEVWKRNFDDSYFNVSGPATFILCGTVGDFIMYPWAWDMVEYNRRFGINYITTNGSMRKPSWWSDFAKLDPTVTFCLDGIDEKSHSTYRIGTDFNQILKNAEAFIKAGGKAKWQFITFEHNSHELDDAMKMAEEMGFKGFLHVWSGRRKTTSSNVVVPEEMIEKVRLVRSRTILEDCPRRGELYISYDGQVMPCCFAAAEYETPGRKFMLGNYPEEEMNLNSSSIEEILENEYWRSVRFKTEEITPMCDHYCVKAIAQSHKVETLFF